MIYLLKKYKATHVLHPAFHLTLIIKIDSVLALIGFPLCLSLSGKIQLLLDHLTGQLLSFLCLLLLRRRPKPAKHSYIK